MTEDAAPSKLERLLKPLGSVFALYFGLSWLAACSYTAIEYKCGLVVSVWTSAAWVVGTLVGFLFGFPKVVQDDNLTANGQGNVLYKLLINTNFAEVSDWLTKIIVGLGLVHAQQIWSRLLELAKIFSTSIGAGDKEIGLGIALVISFSAGGLLFGYLYTRLYLSLLFAKADRETFDSVREQIKVEVQKATNATDRKLEAVTGIMIDKVVSSAQVPDIQRDPETLELLKAATETTSKSESPTGLNQYLRAFNAFSNQHFEEAIKHAECALSIGLPPKRQWSLLNLLGLAHHYRQPQQWKPGDPDEWFTRSKESYERALSLSPSESEALLTKANMTFLYLDRQDYAAVNALAREILKHKADSQLADLKVFDLTRVAFASALVMQGSAPEATAVLNAIEHINEWEYLFERKDVPHETLTRLAQLPGLSQPIQKFLKKFV